MLSNVLQEFEIFVDPFGRLSFKQRDTYSLGQQGMENCISEKFPIRISPCAGTAGLFWVKGSFISVAILNKGHI